MRIAAIADVHSPRYLNEFKESLVHCKTPDLFLLAGDMIDAGKISEYRNVADSISNRFGIDLPIVACLGNDEMNAEISTLFDAAKKRISFLENDSLVIHHEGTDVGIVGAPILDVSVECGEKNVESVFQKKIQKTAELLNTLTEVSDYTIFLLHYSPLSIDTYPEAFSWWVAEAFREARPDLVIHGHIHYAAKPEVRIGDTRIFNVAYPSTREITEIEC